MSTAFNCAGRCWSSADIDGSCFVRVWARQHGALSDLPGFQGTTRPDRLHYRSCSGRLAIADRDASVEMAISFEIAAGFYCKLFSASWRFMGFRVRPVSCYQQVPLALPTPQSWQCVVLEHIRLDNLNHQMILPRASTFYNLYDMCLGLRT